MACNQTLSGLSRDCSPSQGGIVEAYIAPYEDVTGVTVTEGKITAITMATSGSPAVAKKFKKYAFRKGTGNFSSTLNVDPTSGVNYVSTDILMLFSRMETTKRVEMAALSQNDLVMFVKDGNGLYWFFGKDEPVVATAGDGQTGTARGDANRYSITLQDNGQTFPFEILVGTGGVDLSQIVE